MALKSRYNLVSSKSEYSRYYPEFRGVDFSTNPTDIETYRLADAVNVWRDPETEYGGACETFPGFRRLNAFEGRINGVFSYRTLNDEIYVCVHAGNALHVFRHDKRDELDNKDNIKTYTGLADSRSTAFVWQNRLHVLDGTNYYVLDEEKGLSPISDEAYIPTSYADGKEYEQRNMLTPKFKNQYGLGNLGDYEEISSVFAFDIDDKGNAIITGFSEIGDSSSTLRIPSTVSHDGQDITVTAIADNAFCGLPSPVTVILPSTLKRIGNGAFCDCANLNGLYFETDSDGRIDLHEIGDGAFCRCGFVTVSLTYPTTHGENINVGVDAFNDCVDLNTVVLAENVFLETGAFRGGADDICFYCAPGTNRTALEDMDANQEDVDFFEHVESNVETDIKDSFKTLSNLKLKRKYSDSEINHLASTYGKSGNIFADTKNDYFIFIDYNKDLVVQDDYNLIEYRYSQGTWTNDGGAPSGTLPPMSFNLSSSTYIADAIMILFGIAPISTAGDITVTPSKENESITVKGNGAYALYANNDAAFSITIPTASVAFADQHLYKFLIYDPCERVTSVTLDGQDISTIEGMSYVTEADGSLISAVSVITNSPKLLAGGKLVIHGEGKEYRAISGHSNAIAGNSAYNGTSLDAIVSCTISTVFDGRVFLTGNPALPNTVFYSGRMLNGEISPAFFGVLNYFNDGVGNSPVKALSASSSVLMVLKGDTTSEGSIYYHSGADTGLDLIPRVYPAVQGLDGLGCASVGAACNFLDDSVFVSRRGLEAVGKENVNLERTIEHRSYNIDSRLPYEDLTNVRLAEWLGYLVLCTGERWYLADSRQIFQHRSGIYNYEWYVVEGMKTYSHYIVDSFGEKRAEDGAPCGTCCELLALDKVLYFGTTDGTLCCINNDLRGIPLNVNGEEVEIPYDMIPAKYYAHDMTKDAAYGDGYSTGRRYTSGITLKSDNCDIPHLTKTTRRNSIVARHKTFSGRSFKVRCKTDLSGFEDLETSSGYRDLESVTQSSFDLSTLDFSSLSFASAKTQICIIREHYRNRRWVEQQFAIYSDEYQSPFGIYSLAFRYRIGGRIKI